MSINEYYLCLELAYIKKLFFGSKVHPYWKTSITLFYYKILQLKQGSNWVFILEFKDLDTILSGEEFARIAPKAPNLGTISFGKDFVEDA